MKFLSRLFGKDDDSASKSEAVHKYSGLGIFSPAVDAVKPSPTRELRRLEELEAIFVRSKRLETLEDVPYVVNQIREGNIVLLDISRLNDGKEQTHLELKRIIERIRGETRSYQADIALVNDDCVIVAPSFVRL
ncbi:MAG: cell division protein SepF [Candidatus Thorarchaeota archaeon]